MSIRGDDLFADRFNKGSAPLYAANAPGERRTRETKVSRRAGRADAISAPKVGQYNKRSGVCQIGMKQTLQQSESASNLARIPIRECGEPLVRLRDTCPRIAADRTLRARLGVAERLNLAQAWLDSHAPGVRLRVGDAHRSAKKQERFFTIACFVARLLRPHWSSDRVRGLADRYVAEPHPEAPPPHLTGGAVDVGLVLANGRRPDMGRWNLKAVRLDSLFVSPEAARYRRLLSDAMTHAGFSNYEEEWWHWSFGDQGWALRTGRSYAVYDRVES